MNYPPTKNCISPSFLSNSAALNDQAKGVSAGQRREYVIYILLIIVDILISRRD